MPSINMHVKETEFSWTSFSLSATTKKILLAATTLSYAAADEGGERRSLQANADIRKRNVLEEQGLWSL